jgi:hypothetical protein
MDRTERFYKIDQLIRERKLVTFAETLLEELEVSPGHAQARHPVPAGPPQLPADLGPRGRRLPAPAGRPPRVKPVRTARPVVQRPRKSTPCLTMQHLMANLDKGGLLGPHIQPLMAPVERPAATADNTAEAVRKRVRIIGAAARRMHLSHFETVGSALLRRKRLMITYHARGTDETTEREVSPQRLVHYRENWYLDAWCHLRKGLRNFSVDAIQKAAPWKSPRATSPRRPPTRCWAPATASSAAPRCSGPSCTSRP